MAGHAPLNEPENEPEDGAEDGAGSDLVREYPAAPIVTVSAVIAHHGCVLLIRRGKPPAHGTWSLPGGALELGETLTEGLFREILEETGLLIEPVRLLGAFDRILRDASGRVQFHYVLIGSLCTVAGGTPRAGSDASEIAWADPSELSSDPPFSLDPLILKLLASIPELGSPDQPA